MVVEGCERRGQEMVVEVVAAADAALVVAAMDGVGGGGSLTINMARCIAVHAHCHVTCECTCTCCNCVLFHATMRSYTHSLLASFLQLHLECQLVHSMCLSSRFRVCYCSTARVHPSYHMQATI